MFRPGQYVGDQHHLKFVVLSISSGAQHRFNFWFSASFFRLPYSSNSYCFFKMVSETGLGCTFLAAHVFMFFLSMKKVDSYKRSAVNVTLFPISFQTFACGEYPLLGMEYIF